MTIRYALAMAVACASMAPEAAHAQATPAPTATQRPMTPERTAGVKLRCAQLVAFFDRYGVSRGENSDRPRNHTRIGAALECERGNHPIGIATMTVLLKNKAFDVPAPSTPVQEPGDVAAPNITNPTGR